MTSLPMAGEATVPEVPGYQEIPLRNRKREVVAVALVDAADYEALNAHRWHRTGYGYAARSVWRDGRTHMILMHRVLLGLEHGDPRQGDHINRDRLDNRRANLRAVEPGENQQNQGANAGSRSRHRGVCWHKGKRKWMAYSYKAGRIKWLGYFADEDDAAHAAADFRREHMPLSTEVAA